MEEKAGAVIQRLATASLEKCLARISRVSAGAWEITGARVSRGAFEDALAGAGVQKPAAAVYFHVKGEFPFTAMMLVDLDDTEHVLQSYIGCTFPHTGGFTHPEEVMLTELGNIILNSLINAVLNALKKSSMPPVPACAHGEPRALAAALAAGAVPGQAFRTVAIELSIRFSDRVSRARIVGLLPPELEDELERRCGGLL